MLKRRKLKSSKCTGKTAKTSLFCVGIVLQVLVGAGVWLLLTEPQSFLVYFAMVSLMNSYICVHTFSIQEQVLPSSPDFKGSRFLPV